MTQHKYQCGGVAASASWTYLYSYALILNINIISIVGTGNQYGLTGYTAIYGPTKTSFTICVLSLFGWTAAQMLTYSSSCDLLINDFY